MSQPLPPTPARRGRVLVVDDEFELLDVLCEALRDEGFEVAGFADPSAALAAVRRGGFDLLLADQMMPGMSGTELLQRARGIDSGLVGVIMTGYASSQASAEVTSAGAFDLVHKPFRMRQLLPTLDRALSARAEIDPAGWEDGRVPKPNGQADATWARE